MKRLSLLPLLALLGCTLPSQLHVASVEEPGVPPFTPGDRVYLLAGEGSERLRIGDKVDLQRPGDHRTTGRLQVFDVRGRDVLARLQQPGETYPQTGDLGVRREVPALPPLPVLPTPLEWPGTDAFLPLPAPERQAGLTPKREPLRFFPADPVLSPAGRAKLVDWAKTWGRFGAWTVEVPRDPDAAPGVLQARAEGVRERLRELGIQPVALRTIPPVPKDRFDVVFVVMEPW